MHQCTITMHKYCIIKPCHAMSCNLCCSETTFYRQFMPDSVLPVYLCIYYNYLAVVKYLSVYLFLWLSVTNVSDLFVCDLCDPYGHNVDHSIIQHRYNDLNDLYDLHDVMVYIIEWFTRLNDSRDLMIYMIYMIFVICMIYPCQHHLHH